MERLEPDDVASILATTSVSNIAGLLAADPTSKAQAAAHLARDIVTRLNGAPIPDRNQLRLPL